MRTTDNKKDNVLRIRISEDMYKYIISRSMKNNISVSGYIRLLIEKEMRRV